MQKNKGLFKQVFMLLVLSFLVNTTAHARYPHLTVKNLTGDKIQFGAHVKGRWINKWLETGGVTTFAPGSNTFDGISWKQLKLGGAECYQKLNYRNRTRLVVFDGGVFDEPRQHKLRAQKRVCW